MTRKKIKISHIVIGLLLGILIGFEISILLQASRLLPGGWAPAVVRREQSSLVTGLGGQDGIKYTPDVLNLFRDEITQDLEGIEDQPFDQKIRLIRDWVRHQPEGLGIEITSQDPCEIFAEIDRGADASCQPLAIYMVATANSLGFPARRVALFGSPGSFDNAHSTVEVWNGEKWVIQDPTFNSIAVDLNGDLLNVAEVQQRYREGEEVNWVQDMTVEPPDLNDYFVEPSTLFNVVVYQLYEYPSGISKWESRWLRFRDRLAGRVQSVVVTNGFFPGDDFIYNGNADRIILPSAAVVLVVLVTLTLSRGRREQ